MMYEIGRDDLITCEFALVGAADMFRTRTEQERYWSARSAVNRALIRIEESDVGTH